MHPYISENNNSGWDYHMLSITVSQSSGGESLMQSSKSLIDSSWPSHRLLLRHYLHITEASFRTSSPRHTGQAIRKQTTAPCKRSQEKCSCDPSDPSLYPPLKYQTQSHDSEHTAHTQSEPDTAVIPGNMPIPGHQRNTKATGWVNKPRPVFGWCVSEVLTFWWHPVFVRTAGQAPVVGVQARYVTRAVAAGCRTSTVLLVCTWSICEEKVVLRWSYRTKCWAQLQRNTSPRRQDNYKGIKSHRWITESTYTDQA